MVQVGFFLECDLKGHAFGDADVVVRRRNFPLKHRCELHGRYDAAFESRILVDEVFEVDGNAVGRKRPSGVVVIDARQFRRGAGGEGEEPEEAHPQSLS